MPVQDDGSWTTVKAAKQDVLGCSVGGMASAYTSVVAHGGNQSGSYKQGFALGRCDEVPRYSQDFKYCLAFASAHSALHPSIVGRAVQTASSFLGECLALTGRCSPSQILKAYSIMETGLISAGFIVGGVTIGVARAIATSPSIVGPAACALAGATITSIGIAGVYVTLEEIKHFKPSKRKRH
jgi:hypothetical protein